MQAKERERERCSWQPITKAHQQTVTRLRTSTGVRARGCEKERERERTASVGDVWRANDHPISLSLSLSHASHCFCFCWRQLFCFSSLVLEEDSALFPLCSANSCQQRVTGLQGLHKLRVISSHPLRFTTILATSAPLPSPSRDHTITHVSCLCGQSSCHVLIGVVNLKCP